MEYGPTPPMLLASAAVEGQGFELSHIERALLCTTDMSCLSLELGALLLVYSSELYGVCALLTGIVRTK